MTLYAPRQKETADRAHDPSTVQTDESLSASRAIELVDTWSDLPAHRRRDLASALNVISRVAGVPPEILPLTPQHLREHVVNHSAIYWQVKKPTKSNVLCRVRYILQRLGIIDATDVNLSPALAELQDCLDDRSRMSLAAFFRFCTLIDIAPVDISDPILEKFQCWLVSKTLCSNPRNIVNAAQRAWNQAAATISTWPNITLHIKSIRGQLLLPFTTFPNTFQDDVVNYVDKLSGESADNFFGIDDTADNDGLGQTTSACKPLRPLTIEAKAQRVKIAANAFHRSGIAIQDIKCLADLVAPLTHPKAILTQLWSENNKQPSPTLGHVAETLRQIAKFHAGCSPEHVSQIGKWGAKLGIKYKGMTNRNRKLLELISTPERRRTLFNLPEALMIEATEQGTNFRAVVAAQRAVMIEILLKFLPRLGNLIGLRLDQHLMRPDPKTNLISAIIIPAHETKNSRELTYPVSAKTAALLDRWIREFRLHNAAPSNPYLFPGKDDKPMTRQGVRDSIKTITKEKVGVAVNPHLFRHFAAKTFLKAMPGAYEPLRQLMGHAALSTTTNSYCGEEGEAATAQFDQILEVDRLTLGAAKPAAKCRPKGITTKKSGAKNASRS